MAASAAPSTLSVHYCGGELMEASFFENFERCCKVDIDEESPLQFTQTTCEFEQYTFASPEDGTREFSISALDFSTANFYTPLHIDFPYTEEQIPLHLFADTSPPSGKDLCILLERYLL